MVGHYLHGIDCEVKLLSGFVEMVYTFLTYFIREDMFTVFGTPYDMVLQRVYITSTMCHSFYFGFTHQRLCFFTYKYLLFTKSTAYFGKKLEICPNSRLKSRVCGQIFINKWRFKRVAKKVLTHYPCLDSPVIVRAHVFFVHKIPFIAFL